MNPTSAIDQSTADREFVTTHLIDAPRERVFRHGPDGTDYPNESS